MIILTVCVKRNPKMTKKEFEDYWLNKHAPLFKKFADSYKAVRYVINTRLETPLNESMQTSRNFALPYDGVGQIYWNSEADFKAAVSSPLGQELRKMFVADEARFTSLTESSGFFTKEHIIIDKIYGIPGPCQCPIMGKIMSDPVITSDGYTWERQAIKLLLKQTKTNPITKQPFGSEILVPNLALKDLIATLRKASAIASVAKNDERLDDKDIETKVDEFIRKMGVQTNFFLQSKL
jgi:uncharacterized protein (TIGR02118 family)